MNIVACSEDLGMGVHFTGSYFRPACELQDAPKIIKLRTISHQ
jgi:hypothetical protein